MKTNNNWGKIKLLGKAIVMTGNLMLGNLLFLESHNPIGPLSIILSRPTPKEGHSDQMPQTGSIEIARAKYTFVLKIGFHMLGCRQ